MTDFETNPIGTMERLRRLERGVAIVQELLEDNLGGPDGYQKAMEECRQPPAPVQVTGEMVRAYLNEIEKRPYDLPIRESVRKGLEAALQAGVPGDGTLTCLFCAKPLSDNAVQDDNGDSACADCATAEKAAQHKEAMIAALKSYRQADEDGVMVLVSRQAVDEAVAILQAGVPSGWKPIDTAPRDGDDTLVCHHDQRGWQNVYWDNEAQNPDFPWAESCESDSHIHFHKDAFTHWMRPAAPAPGEGS